MAYDKSGRAADGSLDPLRKKVATMMHMMTIGGGGGSDTRKIADDLYQTMKTGEATGGWKIKGSGGSGDGESSGGGGGRITDVDYSPSGERQDIAPRVRSRLSEEAKKMNEGGLVRGAGCAQRGHGRGKMV